MMNFLAISLILTSLVTAGIWSPTPENKQSKDQDVIVKDGHRVVVVEYERQGQPNTKVSISPDQEPHNFDSPSGVSGTFGAAKIKEASSVLPNIGQGLSGSNGQVPNPKELICDAYGKCKHKIADAMGKTKDVVSETARDVKEVAYSKIQKKKDIASNVGEAIEDAYVGAKDTVSHATHEVGERAKESLEKGKSTMKTTKDTGKTIGKDISSNVSDFVEAAGKKASEVKDGAFRYLDTPETLKSLMGVLHLMGFATAYGMCIWVTFISSHVLAGNLPRQQFGILQSKIYPVYFRAMTGVIGLALFGHLLGHRKRLFESRAYMFHVYTLLAPLLMVLANMLYLEPRATKVMFERMKVEKEEGRGREELVGEPGRRATEAGSTISTPENPSQEQVATRNRIMKLNERLKKLNVYSSFLNILSLMALSLHLVHLGRRIHLSC